MYFFKANGIANSEDPDQTAPLGAQCSRKLPTLYRTFGQTEYESLSDRQNFCLTEKQSVRFGKIIKGGGCVCVWGGGGFFYNKFSIKI